jgi:hypothetical protein
MGAFSFKPFSSLVSSEYEPHSIQQTSVVSGPMHMLPEIRDQFGAEVSGVRTVAAERAGSFNGDTSACDRNAFGHSDFGKSRFDPNTTRKSGGEEHFGPNAGFQTARELMPEMAHAGEGHGHAALIGGGDHFRVAH